MSEDCHCSNNSKIKKDNAAMVNFGPYGPYPDRKVYNLFEEQTTDLANSMQWMLKDLMFRARETDLPTCQSDEMKLALNSYRDLCLLIGKDPTLL